MPINEKKILFNRFSLNTNNGFLFFQIPLSLLSVKPDYHSPCSIKPMIEGNHRSIKRSANMLTFHCSLISITAALMFVSLKQMEALINMSVSLQCHCFFISWYNSMLLAPIFSPASLLSVISTHQFGFTLFVPLHSISLFPNQFLSLVSLS